MPENRIPVASYGESQVQTAVLTEGSIPPGFTITFLRYDAEREQYWREYCLHTASGSLGLDGQPVDLIHGKVSGDL